MSATLQRAVAMIREFVADSVIQATGTVEFEDGLRTVVLEPLEHLGVQVGPGGGVVVIGTLLSDPIPILLSSTHQWC